MTAVDELSRRRDQLLEATLPHVLFDGWSMAALRNGARDLGLAESEIPLIFPGGGGEAALWLDDWADRKMLDALERMDLTSMKVRERVAAGIEARLAVLGPYREAVRRSIALKATPFGAVRAASAIYRTVDAIWYAAGDTATDFNFYTKRSLLAAAYAPTVLYWLDDRSEDGADTRGFLERRLADVMKLPRLLEGVRKAAGRLTAPFDYLRQQAGR